MILFVAYTGTILMNILNLRANLLSDETADLYIIDIQRIPKELIELAKNSNYFHKVILLKPFDVEINNKLDKYPFVLKKLLYYILSIFKTKYYEKQIFNNSYCLSYDKIITHGLWLDSIFIIRTCYLNNHSIEISMIEEGTSAWSRSFEGLTNQLVALRYSYIASIIWKIRWILETGHSFSHDLSIYQKLIKRFYLYVPSFSLLSKDNKHLCSNLPIFDKNNKLLPKLMQLGSAIDLSQLKTRKIIVFMHSEGLISEPEHTCFINNILPLLLEKWKTTDIVLKSHPDFSLDETYYQEKYPGIFIDNRKYQLEIVFPHLNLNDKILITRISTSVFSPKSMFNLEPYVLFVGLLYSNSIKIKDDLSKMVFDLKSLYHNTNKVMLPHTIKEFSDYIDSFSIEKSN